jgi:hypothetical protein
MILRWEWPSARPTIGGDIYVSPDLKRKTIGAEFIAVFEGEAERRGVWVVRAPLAIIVQSP